MDFSSVLIKTEKGLQEIDKRTHKLAGRLRAVLIMIDGNRTLGAMLDQAGELAAQLEEQLGQLQAEGYIEELLPPQPQVVPASAAPSAPEQAVSTPATSQPVARNAVPAAPGPVRKAPDWTAFPLENHKARLRKMLAETLGMRAMFATAQLDQARSHADLENLVDDLARSMATASGAPAAQKWRDQARTLLGINQ